MLKFLLMIILLLYLTFLLTVLNKLIQGLQKMLPIKNTSMWGVRIWFGAIIIAAVIGGDLFYCDAPISYKYFSILDFIALAFCIYLFSAYSGYEVSRTKKDILVFALIFPIGEEILFRGIIQSLAKNYLSFGAASMDIPIFGMMPFAVVISAFCFGITHLQYRNFKIDHTTVKQMLFAFIFGLYAGKIVIRTESILLPVILHVAVNSCAVLYGMNALRNKKG